MDILKPYRDAGVKTFIVRNNEAIADNPYKKYDLAFIALATVPEISRKWQTIANLPPLPTSGIPNGTAKIEDVEEIYQYRNDFIEWTEALAIKMFGENYRQDCFNQEPIREKTEQTAEGIEQIKQLFKSHPETQFFDKNLGDNFVPLLFIIKEYAESQLAQYKEKLVADVKELGFNPGVSICDQIIDLIEGK